MDRQFGDARYTSIFVEDRMEGFGGYELMRIRNGNKTRIAQVLYWDACGQFFVETFNSDVPLTVLEDLIAETKATIKTR